MRESLIARLASADETVAGLLASVLAYPADWPPAEITATIRPAPATGGGSGGE